VLQRLELLRSLQLRIGFGNGQQSAQRVGELSLSLTLFRWSRSGHGGATVLGNIFKGTLFMGGITLHGLHQIGDEIVAALELHIDIGPRVVGAYPQLHQSVVNTDEYENNDRQQNDDDNETDHLNLPPIRQAPPWRAKTGDKAQGIIPAKGRQRGNPRQAVVS